MRTSSGSESNFNDPISTDDQLVALNKTRKVIAETRDSFHRLTQERLRESIVQARHIASFFLLFLLPFSLMFTFEQKTKEKEELEAQNTKGKRVSTSSPT